MYNTHVQNRNNISPDNSGWLLRNIINCWSYAATDEENLLHDELKDAEDSPVS